MSYPRDNFPLTGFGKPEDYLPDYRYGVEYSQLEEVINDLILGYFIKEDGNCDYKKIRKCCQETIKNEYDFLSEKSISIIESYCWMYSWDNESYYNKLYYSLGLLKQLHTNNILLGL